MCIVLCCSTPRTLVEGEETCEAGKAMCSVSLSPQCHGSESDSVFPEFPCTLGVVEAERGRKANLQAILL